MSARRTAPAALVLLALATAACSGGDPAGTAASQGSPSVGPTTATPAPATGSTPATSATSATEPTGSTGTGSARPTGGTQERPAATTPPLDRLAWHPLGPPSVTTVTATPSGSVSVDRSGGTVTVTDRRGRYTLAAPTGSRWSDVVSNGTTLVVSAQDKGETKPARATVISLTDRSRRTLDGASRPATVNGGAWALDDARVYHATTRRGRYCLAAVDLADLRGRVTYCAPVRGGFSDVVTGTDGTSLLTFGGRPGAGGQQCRTPARLTGSAAVPLVGVARCLGWDAALLPDGAVWSVVPKPHQVETAHFYARVGDAFYDLGTGSTGSLVRCGSAAYFGRDSGSDQGRAEVLRWSPTSGLAVVYTSPGAGQAFVSAPRCAGRRLTVSEFGEGGDQQVWAEVS